MRDILIPYKRNDSGELEACIALIKKNVPHRNIYVLEEYEKSVFSGVSHINQILKLQWALENLDVTDEFYLFNDDFFVMEPVDDIPYLHRGTISSHLSGRVGGSYTNALKITKEHLGGEALSYELHVPMLFDKKKLLPLLNLLERNIEIGKCPLIRSLYGNHYDVGGVETIDVKNPQDYRLCTFLSTNERSFKGPLGDYIRSKI